ncbi:MAG: YolD-like family protein [Clostridia bacterium]|nr:YolD-like family protein [Clostridia bacterium]
MKDRGAIKWSAMMLPEHRKLLEKLLAEQQYVEKPSLAQDKCEEINRVLLEALAKGKKVGFKIYQDHAIQSIEGVITRHIPEQRKLKIIAETGRIIFLNLEKIVDAEIIE